MMAGLSTYKYPTCCLGGEKQMRNLNVDGRRRMQMQMQSRKTCDGDSAPPVKGSNLELHPRMRQEGDKGRSTAWYSEARVVCCLGHGARGAQLTLFGLRLPVSDGLDAIDVSAPYFL